jgi:hypothetical protein
MIQILDERGGEIEEFTLANKRGHVTCRYDAGDR